ncbi:hypothetical protein ECG_09697 [Echinococcus granulosus]|nr:hypothetical protein ECG_09697 [Echinococcus granulosus]
MLSKQSERQSHVFKQHVVLRRFQSKANKYNRAFDLPSWLFHGIGESTAYLKMLELSVLSSVTVILNYVLQCINGGLLNVFFTPTYNQTSKQTTYEFGMNQDRLMKYVKGVLTISGKDLPLDVLKTFPESIGGGDKGVKEAQENPNREVIFIIGPVAAAIIMLIAILGLILINFCTCTTKGCHNHKKKKPKSINSGGKSRTKPAEVAKVEEREGTRQGPSYNRQFDNGYDGYAFYRNKGDNDSESDTTTDEEDEPKDFGENVRDLFTLNKTTAFGSKVEKRQEKIMEKVEEIAERSEFVHKNQGWICCSCHLLTMLLDIVYVVGLIVCVVVYIMAAQQVAQVMEQPSSDNSTLKNQVVAWLGNKSSYYNLPGTVSFVLNETVVLLDEIATNLINTMNKTLDDLKGQMNTTVLQGATVIFNKLQSVTGIDKVFNETFRLSMRLTDLMSSVNATAANYNSTIKNVVSLNATFAQCYSEIKANCTKSNCTISDTELEILLFKFNATAVVYPLGADALQAIVNQFNDFAAKLEELQKEMNAMPSQLASNITSNLNFTSQINDLKSQLDGALNEVKPHIEDVAKHIPQYVDKARPYITPALYSPAAVIAVIALIFFACLLLFVAEAFHRRLFSPTGKAPSELAEVFRDKRRSHICGGCRFLICSILFILLIILSLLAAVVLVVCSILAVEVCPYVYMEKGMNQSDYVLNSILAGKWPAIQQQNELLDVAPPKNILYGLSVVCVPTNKTDPKLLPSLGIDKLANVTKLAEKEEFKKKITDLINQMATTISGQIPPDLLQKLENMKQEVDKLKTFLQYYNAENAVKELAKFTGVNMAELEQLLVKVKTQLQGEPVAQELEEAIKQLKENKTKIEVLQNAYQGIANQSTIPDDLKQYIDDSQTTIKASYFPFCLSNGIIALLQNETELQSVMQKDIKPMLLDLLVMILEEVTSALNGLVTKIMPCANMHYILEALVATGCSSTGLVTRFFGWALALTLTILFSFLSFVGLFNLWCIQSHQIKRFYGA